MRLRFSEKTDLSKWNVLHEVSETHPVASQTDSRYDLERTPWNGNPIELNRRLVDAISKLPDTDIKRAKEVFSAFVNSPLPEDRILPLMGRGFDDNSVVKLVKADHDYGLTLWDYLIRDTDKRIRDNAESILEAHLSFAHGTFFSDGRDRPANIHPEGMRYLDDIMDDDELLNMSGLTRQDVYRLLESYAYAENGQHFRRLGSEALYRLIDAHVVPKRSKPSTTD